MPRQRRSARRDPRPKRRGGEARCESTAQNELGNQACLKRLGRPDGAPGRTDEAHAMHAEAMTTDGEIRSTGNGEWLDPTTWAGGVVPEAGHVVHIDHKVIYNAYATESEPYAAVNVHKLLQFDWTQDTHMVVQDLNVMSGGTLRIRGEKRKQPLPEEYSAGIEFAAAGELDPKAEAFTHQLGLFSYGGDIEMIGRQVERVASFDTQLDAGKKSLGPGGHEELDGWGKGDEVLLTADGYDQDGPLQNEVGTLRRVGRQGGLNLKNPAEYGHAPILGEPHRVANLSGNINLTSADTSIEQRGQVAMMKSTKGESGKGSFDSVVFDGLGRTDKSKTLSDDNQRGMYPLHFHETGMDTKHTVRNSVVKGSPGWGFVNHGSNVDFEDNVVYDATGAGFVTERGDERGTFNGNLAAGSRGVTDENDDPSLPFRRLYLDDPDRLAEADLGFHGHGFFITSPFVDVKDNAAVGNRDSGFLYYGLGLDHHSVEQRSSEKPGPLTTSVELTDDEKATAGFEAPPRFWDSEEKGAADRFPIMDLPFFGGWDDNYTAANNKGMQLRYGRSLNTTAIDRFAGRKKGKKGEDGKTVMDEGAQQLVWSNGKRGKSDLFDKRTSMSGLTAMNNKVGLHVGYSSLIDFDDIHIGRDERTPGVGRESKKDFKEKALTGIENANNNREHAFTNTVVDGYEIGLRTNNKDGLKGGHRNQDITWKNVSKNVLKLDDQQQRGIRK